MNMGRYKNIGRYKEVDRFKGKTIRILCPKCGYPMRVLEKDSDGVYQCYCANCKMDRFMQDTLDKKNTIEQLKKEVDFLKGYREDVEELTIENEQLKQKSDRKQKHIVVLENKIHRMREAIHKLEWLSTYRNAELIRENYKLKKFREDVFAFFTQEILEENELLEYYLREKEFRNGKRQMIILGVLRRVEKEMKKLVR